MPTEPVPDSPTAHRIRYPALALSPRYRTRSYVAPADIYSSTPLVKSRPTRNELRSSPSNNDGCDRNSSKAPGTERALGSVGQSSRRKIHAFSSNYAPTISTAGGPTPVPEPYQLMKRSLICGDKSRSLRSFWSAQEQEEPADSLWGGHCVNKNAGQSAQWANANGHSFPV